MGIDGEEEANYGDADQGLHNVVHDLNADDLQQFLGVDQPFSGHFNEDDASIMQALND